MITNHGIHDWQIRSGLTDTGGQNQYVAALSGTLADFGFRVTTYNRGGFPDPMTSEPRTGSRYKDEHQRIVYLEGGGNQFIRKEDLDRRILDEEAAFAEKIMREENLPIDFIISHYWDGALLAGIIIDRMNLKAKHVWVPHSLGALKKDNFKGKPAEIIAPLKFDERIAYEKGLLSGVDAVASTSSDISRHLKESYGREAELFLPPCIETTKFHPIDDVAGITKIYDFLKETDPKTGVNVRGKTCVLEMSRTDRTKRKDVVVRAFAEVLKTNPDIMLLLRINLKSKEVAGEIESLVDSLGIRDNVVYVGMVPDNIMTEIFAISTVYLSPSEMEGFGMSVQEACACRRPVISSDLVPFAVEFLLKDTQEETIDTPDGKVTIRWGAGGAVIPAGKVQGFVHALKTLLDDNARRQEIAKTAYEITIPYFTWPNMTKRLLEEMGMEIPNK